MIKKLFSKFCMFLVKKNAKKIGLNLKVNGYTKVNRNTEIGDNVNFNGLKILGKGNVKIGDNFHSAKDILFITDIHNYEGKKLPYDSEVISKDIIIEENVWIGQRVIVLGGVKIAEGAIIQAGSVVVSDIPKYAIAGGHPAKVFKYRNKEHYLNLKEKGELF